ncbi:MAG: hypothetical protein UIB40_03870 [Paludibacteraceae bacterium]|nr:hypothetical protein [Paludibacteraceae bacterium]
MKPYLKPVTEFIDIQSKGHMMALPGSFDHGVIQNASAPKTKPF